MKIILNIIIGIIVITTPWKIVYSQHKHLEGIVYEQAENKQPLINANIYWAETTIGTVSDQNGRFHINKQNNDYNKLVVSYIGYEKDTILIAENQEFVEIILLSSNKLDEVIVSERVDGSYISKLEPINTTVISENGLQQLACCNLSESFENSATVDVHFADAVTGAKQIQMLGLAGIYTQILTENVPTFRGFSSSFGLNYVPGSWMESIQISKGTSSVINGYESITGQINIEYKKPQLQSPLHVNIYANNMQRMEANVLTGIQLSDRLSTMVMIHGNQLQHKIDKNNDGFLDMPMSEQINISNRWSYEIEGKYHSQFNVNILDENRDGGQLAYYTANDDVQDSYYGMNIKNQRIQAYWKNGIQLPFVPNQSLGLITSFTSHELKSQFGNKYFNGLNRFFYANLIYQQSLFNTNHNLSAGLSFNYDENLEELDAIKLNRNEIVQGIFLQHTFNYANKTTSILGIRYDHNSEYGSFITPRIHLKHKIGEHTIARASFGKGVRTSNIIAENIGYLAESRDILITLALKPEEAWNYGFHINHDIHFGDEREISLNVDYYRTSFENQVVIDIESDNNAILVYNLDGQSFSNSYQVEVSSEVIPRLDILTAFRFNDVRVEQFGELKQKPLTSRVKGLLQISYATNYNIWQFDVTNQFVGKSRLPDLTYLPNELKPEAESKSFYMLHVQITKRFKYFDVYAGAENLTNFTQKNPIIDPQHPFDENFNSTIIWGPILGRKIYAGIRYTID